MTDTVTATATVAVTPMTLLATVSPLERLAWDSFWTPSTLHADHGRHYIKFLLEHEAAVFQNWIEWIIRTSKPKTRQT